MYCNKCGKEISSNEKFCAVCGNRIGNACEMYIKESETEITNKFVSTKIKYIIAIMSIVIVLMSFFIIVNFITDGSEKSNINISDANSKVATTAISELTDKWEEIFDNGNAGNGYLEILHTRIVKIDPPNNDEFFSPLIEEKGEIDCIVEFILYSDRFSSAPYYHNPDSMDTVIFYKNGSIEVTDNVLSVYSKYTFNYDYSNIVTDIEDCGTAYNKVIELNLEEK